MPRGSEPIEIHPGLLAKRHCAVPSSTRRVNEKSQRKTLGISVLKEIVLPEMVGLKEVLKFTPGLKRV